MWVTFVQSRHLRAFAQQVGKSCPSAYRSTASSPNVPAKATDVPESKEMVEFQPP